MSLLATMRHGAFMIFQLLLEELSVPIVPLKCGKNEKETKLVVSNLKIWNLVEGIKLAAPCKLCVEHLWAGFNLTYKTNQTKLMYLGFIKKK